MKLSVIIGVIQMTFGILIKGVNDLLFTNYLNFFFEFIPQIIFMSITFGYMIFMIFYKWLTDWTKDTSNAPSILTIMMNMILKFGKITGKPIWNESELSINQETLNYNFLIISISLIPIMLFIKPLFLIYKIQKKNKKLNYIRNEGLLNN
jgi:V-type H+-transporting ATPase subunit a